MFSSRTNVVRVAAERWLQAQEWELSVWQHANAPRGRRQVFAGIAHAFARRLHLRLLAPHGGDDWNDWWAEQFDRYAHIPGSLQNVLELGCGPYTNVRHLLARRQVQHVVCSDPLIRHYVRFRKGWLAWAYWNQKVLIDDHPAEETPFADDYFDVVLMINVLDHVRDAALCLAEAIRVTRPGGHLVLGQDLTGPEDFLRWPDLEDVGHPITLNHEQLDQLLLTRFDVAKRSILPREQGRNPPYHYGTYCFIGKKREADHR